MVWKVFILQQMHSENKTCSCYLLLSTNITFDIFIQREDKDCYDTKKHILAGRITVLTTCECVHIIKTVD